VIHVTPNYAPSRYSILAGCNAPLLDQTECMSDEDAAIICRVNDRAQSGPCQVARIDLMRVLSLAGLNDTRPYLRLGLMRDSLVTMDPHVLRAIIRQARARAEAGNIR
jgi:hypothetical protein